MQTMRRFLVLLVLCLLPVQISWAAVASYCGHESGDAAGHLGHHVDTYHASPLHAGEDDAGDPLEKNTGSVHDHCHLSGFLGIPVAPTLTTGLAARVMQFDVERRHASPLPDQPERPQWVAAA